jgi:hypothetical protein
MAQASVQYTPVQVLQAARRAEAEGKMDYALQFYRHIVEHHGTSVEAQEAREGLFRIAEWRWGEARVARRQEAGIGNSAGSPAPNSPVGSGAVSSSPVNAGGNSGGGNGYSGQRPAVAAVNPQPAYTPESPDQAVPMTGATRMPQIIAREVAKAEARDEPIALKARYRTGKICASLVTGCGWVGLAAGIAIFMAALSGALPQFAAPTLIGLPLGFLLAAPAVVGGLVLVVAGYLAIAVFESANATLEMLNMRRR